MSSNLQELRTIFIQTMEAEGYSVTHLDAPAFDAEAFRIGPRHGIAWKTEGQSLSNEEIGALMTHSKKAVAECNSKQITNLCIGTGKTEDGGADPVIISFRVASQAVV